MRLGVAALLAGLVVLVLLHARLVISECDASTPAGMDSLTLSALSDRLR
jgi:hypothetical protein